MDTVPDNEEEEFMTVRVLGRLITKDNENFDKMFGGSMGDVPIDEDEIVLPVFDLEFVDFNSMPEHSTRKMIEEEIDSTVVRNRGIAKVVDKVDPEEVSGVQPIGKPKTQDIEVGYIAVTPSQSGIISKFYMDKLTDTV